MLEPTNSIVLKEKGQHEATGINLQPYLLKKSGQLFYDTSPLDIKEQMGDRDNIRGNLLSLA